MGPELALPTAYAATLSREAASRREETTTATAPSVRDGGASALPTEGDGPLPEITPAEVG
jgi:hypothetical protein